MMKKYSLPEELESKRFFEETGSKEIPLDIVDKSLLYRNGRHVYITHGKQMKAGKSREVKMINSSTASERVYRFSFELLKELY